MCGETKLKECGVLLNHERNERITLMNEFDVIHCKFEKMIKTWHSNN